MIEALLCVLAFAWRPFGMAKTFEQIDSIGQLSKQTSKV